MSSKAFNEAKRRTDVYFEQEKDNQRMQDIYDILDADQALADEYGFAGKIGGSLLGFIFGGIEGARAGGELGSQVRFFAPEEFEVEDLDWTYDEGKFNVGALGDFREDVLADRYDYEMGEYVSAFGDIINAYDVLDEPGWGGWANTDTLYHKYLSPDAFERRSWDRYLVDEDEPYYENWWDK